MHKKRITISDIAATAGVDKSTVSLVLNNKPLAKRIKPETKKRIINIAAKLNYSPSFMARSLFSGKTKTLGLIIGDIAKSYFSELAGMALEAVYKHNYQMLISVTQWDYTKEYEALQTLLERQVDGIIFCYGGLSTYKGLYEQIIDQHYPVVVYDYEEKGMSSVISDYTPGLEAAIKMFVANGHKKIGYIGITIEWNGKQNSLDTLICKYGLEQTKYIFDETSAEVLKNLAEEIVKPQHPRAFIVADDQSALILIGMLEDCGKKVPDDFDIVGIDGIEWGACSRPALTSITQDREKLMTSAVDMLIDMSNNPKWEPEKIVVPTKLIVRNTVKRR